MEDEHFSHPDHLLISINQVLNHSGDLVICSGCDEPIWGPCYSCTFCYYFLHKKCAELPREINRHIHSAHPLHLLAKPPSHYNKCVCDLCNKTCERFVYHCSICKFDLDIKCALPPCFFEVDGKEHQFICLPKSLSLKSVSFTCNACGIDGEEDDPPFMCTICQVIVHKTCISFPRTIKLNFHQHPRTIHTYHLQQWNSRNKYCGVCRDGIDTDYGVYYCPDCDFVAHVKCGREYHDSEQEEERSITMDDDFKESSFDIVREIKHGEEQIIAEIKHFSHQHNLILIDEINNDLKCDGCMLPIFIPCYSCGDCNFFLDKACIGLPRLKYWQYDVHPMILILNTREDLFECIICKQSCHGFSYYCDGCDHSLDVRCLKLSKDSIEHSGHEHPLYLAAKSESRYCRGCGVRGESAILRCVDCEFNLNFKCATLPNRARHRYDEHPLFLTHIDPNDYQFFCDICEKERDPKLWFYRCEECKFDAHTECALGKYPFIKLGGSYKYDIHPHPLSLVEKTELYPPCHTCGEPCDDLALECTQLLCNFIVHWWTRTCYDPSLKRDHIAGSIYKLEQFNFISGAIFDDDDDSNTDGVLELSDLTDEKKGAG